MRDSKDITSYMESVDSGVKSASEVLATLTTVKKDSVLKYLAEGNAELRGM